MVSGWEKKYVFILNNYKRFKKLNVDVSGTHSKSKSTKHPELLRGYKQVGIQFIREYLYHIQMQTYHIILNLFTIIILYIDHFCYL